MPGQPLPHARAQWPGSGERSRHVWLAKETWNHADWNRFYQRILCYSHYSQRALAHFGNAKAVGNPRFDAWHNGTFDRILPEKYSTRFP